ncbi:MAG: zinc-dependent metalloprotease, partial [Deltaproteobacteria bacterium]|nr:zinc-dependent metalloprotease [Deltaproteobacteria bacterium]
DAEPDLAQFDVRDEAGNVVGSSVPFPQETRAQNKICGPKGLNPQIGDMRYSFQYWVTAPQLYSPLGYGPHSADAETGRVFQANAYLYGAAMETYATMVTDMVSLMVDDLSEEEIADGNLVRSLLQERLGKVPEVFKSADALRGWAKDRRIDVRAQQLISMAKQGELNHSSLVANLEAMRGSWASNYLVTEEIVKGLGDGSDLATVQTDPAKRAELDPATWGNPAFFAYSTRRTAKLSAANITAADFYDDALWARAVKMAEQYRDLDKRARYQAIRRDLLKELYVASMVHEVGHTLGLRHNFAASADALNYFTGGKPFNKALADTLAPRVDTKLGGKEIDPTNYWSVRPLAQHEGVAQAQLTNPLQPTYLVPFDPYVLRSYPLKELQYTSIMDYSAKPNGDLFGPGKYDFAAIRFAYGNLIDVFDPAAAGYPGHTLPADLPQKLKAGEVHYTFLPYLFAGTRDPKDMQKGIDLMVKGRKTIRLETLQAARTANPATAPIEVPYLFCSDEYADGSSVCYRFDEGADMYEMTQNVQSMYENMYWFNNFKNGRVRFALGGSVQGYASRIMDRYFNVLSNQYKHFVNDELIVRSGRNATCLADFESEEGNDSSYVDHYVSPLCGLDQLASAYSSLNFFGHVLATPEVGRYGFNPDVGTYQLGFEGVASGSQVAAIDIGVGTGKFAQSLYDRERYGYDFFYKPVTIGSWWDKYLAIEALGNPYTKFIGVDSNSDVLAYLINFTDLFYAEVNNMVGALAIEDFQSYSPAVDDAGKVVFRDAASLFRDSSPSPAHLTPLDPSEQYTTRLVAAFLGISFFSEEKSDTKFINSIKINVAGNGDAPAVSEELRNDPYGYVEIVDPTTHKTYWATRYDHHNWDGSVDYGAVPLGFTLLQNIKARVTAPSGAINGGPLASELHFVEILRGMVHQWEYVRGF